MIKKKLLSAFAICTAALMLVTGCDKKEPFAPAERTPVSLEDIGIYEQSDIYVAAPSVEEAEVIPETEPETVPETEAPETEPETESENIGLTALAQVANYVNVRSGPTTESDVVGKIYGDCAAMILDEETEPDGSWFFIESGNVKGYVKSEYFLVGEAAEQKREEVGVLKGVVTEDYLRVRSEPDTSNPDNVFTFYEKGTEVFIKEMTEDGWAVIETDAASTGYVYGDCMNIERTFKTAITLEEEAEEIARREAAEEAARIAEEEYQAALAAQEEAERLAAEQQAQWEAQQAAWQNQQAAEQQAQAQAAQQAQWEAQQAAAQAAAQSAADGATASLRSAVVAEALSHVGRPYVHGGRSLDYGTDCSGFTSLVYQKFGYSLAWDPAGQLYGGYQQVPVDWNTLLPGDLLFYSNSQKYLGHVAMYIGNGQIVHAGTEATGICVMNANYRNPIGAIRLIN